MDNVTAKHSSGSTSYFYFLGMWTKRTQFMFLDVLLLWMPWVGVIEAYFIHPCVAMSMSFIKNWNAESIALYPSLWHCCRMLIFQWKFTVVQFMKLIWLSHLLPIMLTLVGAGLVNFQFPEFISSFFARLSWPSIEGCLQHLLGMPWEVCHPMLFAQ